MKRQISDCPHRVPAAAGSYQCNLVRQIVQINDQKRLFVDDSICGACCEAFVPTVDDWNSVIASRVFQLASEIASEGGAEGCSAEAAEQLTLQAIDQLPVVNADEDDCVDDVQDFEPPVGVTLQDLNVALPPPAVRAAGVDSQPAVSWSVGVTTAPRRQSTLSTCVESLLASGWKNPHLFVDGQVDLEDSLRPICRKARPESIGAWPAWCNAVETLLEDDADTLLVIQDDTLFPYVESMRRYVESMLWPEDQPCLISLYTSTDDMQPGNFWRKLPNRWKFGALAFVIPADLARDIVESNQRGELNVVQGTAGIDTRIGCWAEQRNIPVWHPSPSLVQHIGQVSSVWKTSRAVGLRRADRFIGVELG